MDKTNPDSKKTEISPLETGPKTDISSAVALAYESGGTLTPFAPDLQNSVILTATALSNIMFFLSGPPGIIVGIAVFAGILAATIPLLWSDEDSNSTWLPISRHINELIETKLTDVMITLATSQAKSLIMQTESIKNNLEAWINSGKLNGKDLLRNSIFTLLNTYIPAMENLIQGDYRGAILPQYVQAALHYVTTLKAIYPYADELQLNARDLSSGKSLILSRLQEAIPKFVDTAIASYKYGLDSIVAQSAPSSGGTPSTWLDYNQYRNLMSSTALDVIALLPYFDVEKYPTIPAGSWLNRKLFTLLDTSPTARYADFGIHNIKAFESFAQNKSALESLSEIQHGFAYTVVTAGNTVDGLIFAQCTVKSVDGYAFHRRLESSGMTDEHMRYHNLILNDEQIYTISGDYWNGTEEGDYFHPFSRVITSTNYSIGLTPDKITQHILKFSQSGISTTSGRSEFATALPINVGKDYPPNKTSERLIDIRIPPMQRPKAYAYLYSWKHPSVPDDMLPKNPHEPSSRTRYIEQYHAIKAGKSIHTQNLKVIPGPVFTGGDLVELGPGKRLEFFMQREAWRWFSGAYIARLWYVKSRPTTINPNIGISIESPGFVSSSILHPVPHVASNVDMNNLKYTDLGVVEFPSTLLLVAAMNSITLTIANTALSNSIIIDRLELIYDFHATA